MARRVGMKVVLEGPLNSQVWTATGLASILDGGDFDTTTLRWCTVTVFHQQVEAEEQRLHADRYDDTLTGATLQVLSTTTLAGQLVDGPAEAATS